MVLCAVGDASFMKQKEPLQRQLDSHWEELDHAALVFMYFFTNGGVKQNEYRVPGARAAFLGCTLLDSLLTPPLLFASALVLGGKGTHLNVWGVFKPSHADYTRVQQVLEMYVHQCLN